MNIPKSYEALAADLASEKIISKTLQGQKEAYMMLADSRKIELDDALARETELKSGLKTTLNDLHGRDDAVYDLRIDLKAAQDRESALREELESIKASVDGYDSPEHAAQVADEMGYQCIALQKRLTVAEQRAGELLIMLRMAWGSDHVSAEDCRRIDAALKPAAEGEGS